MHFGLQGSQSRGDTQGKQRWHQGITLFAALRLHDAVDDPCVVSPQEGGRLAVQQPYKREEVGSIGCMAEGTEHGMPTNEVVGPDTINRKDSQGGVHLALELEAVCEGLGASTGSKCILGAGCNIERRGEVLSQSPGNGADNHRPQGPEPLRQFCEWQ